MRKTAYNDLEIESIDETSAVDNPAQVGARAAIFKRAIANTDGDPVVSGTVAKTQENQNVTKVEDQPALDAVQKQLTAVQAELAAAKAEGEIQKSIAGLSDAERALYRGLDQGGQSAFLKLSQTERIEKVRAAGESNPVVYTSLDGEAFRKNDDPRLVSMAKRGDEDRKQLLIEKAERQREQFAKRATAELPNFPGDESVKVALLKAVESAPEQKERDGIKAMLKAGNDALSKAFESRGTSNGGAGGDAETKLESLAKGLAEKKNITIAKAWDEVLQTDEGRALYQESVA